MILHFRFVQLIASGKTLGILICIPSSSKTIVSYYRPLIQFNFAFLKQLTKTQHVLFFG